MKKQKPSDHKTDRERNPNCRTSLLGNSQDEAAHLAKDLYNRGFLVLAISPVADEDGTKFWDVEARIQETPSVAASRQTSEELTRLSAQFDALYDGWGTSI
jgi:regulator of RNase E activity RraB